MPKMNPVVIRIRHECVAIIDKLIAQGKHDTYKDAFWYVYHTSLAKRTRCGFDASNFDRAYEQYRRWKSKHTERSYGQTRQREQSPSWEADYYTDEF